VPAEPLTAGMGRAEPPGFYGKIPARGDFLGRRLSRAFIEAWDGWLQQGLLAVKSALGPRWLDIYLTSPLWRFALTAGCCGPRAVAGIVMPSVDSVGRYFPLMAGCELPAESDLAASLAAADAWFRTVEDLALAALTQNLDPDVFDRPVPLTLVADRAGPAMEVPLVAPGRHYLSASDAELAPLLRRYAAALTPGRTLWWTTGSAQVAPCLLLAAGLPDPPTFPALLDGDFIGRGWQSEADGATPPRQAGADDVLAWDRESDPPAAVTPAPAPTALPDQESEAPPAPVEPTVPSASAPGDELVWDRDEPPQPVERLPGDDARAPAGDASPESTPPPSAAETGLAWDDDASDPPVASRDDSAEGRRAPAPAGGSDVLAWDRE
jgi:type VI secretion system protein ImpM